MMTKDQKDILKSELFDIASGLSTTVFIFKRKDGSLHGFRVPTDKIELKDFNIREEEKDTIVAEKAPEGCGKWSGYGSPCNEGNLCPECKKSAQSEPKK